MWEHRSFDRLVSFTDAVTAVAITLLILPIISVRPSSDDSTVWQVVSDNSGPLISFGFTFVVVAVMWQVHLRVFHRLRAFDATIFWLNNLWLIAIVLLPWTSSMYGEGIGTSGGEYSGGEGLGGTGLLYWGNLALVSWAGALIGLHSDRHPELRDPEIAAVASPRRGFIFGVGFLVVGVATVVSPIFGPWLALGLIPLGFLLSRLDAKRLTRDG